MGTRDVNITYKFKIYERKKSGRKSLQTKKCTDEKMPDEEKSDENLLDEKNAMESSQLGGVSRPRAARPRRHPLLAPCQELTLHFGVVLELGDKSLFISPWKPHLTRVIAACCYQ